MPAPPVTEDKTSQDLRRQLDSIERELLGLSLKQQELATPSQRRQKSRTAPQPPQQVTRASFLAAQRSRSPCCARSQQQPQPQPPVITPSAVTVLPRQVQTAGDPKAREDFLLDLISHPAPSRPLSTAARSARATPRNIQSANYESFHASDDDGEEDEEVPDEELSSRPSSGLVWFRQGRARNQYASPRSHGTWKRSLAVPVPRSPVTKADYVEDSEAADESNGPVDTVTTTEAREEMLRCFEQRLADEKERLDVEFQQTMESVERELDEVRKKRQMDREAHLAAQEQLQKEIRMARDETNLVNDQMRRLQQELSASKVKRNDLEKENERLEKELTRAELRATKLTDRQEEMQLVNVNLRRENEDLMIKSSDQDKEIQRLHKELSSAQIKLQEQFNTMTQNNDRLGRLEAEKIVLQDELDKYSKENNMLKVEKSKVERKAEDLQSQIQRLDARIIDRDRACRMAEERVMQLQKDLRAEVAELEKAQMAAAELMGKHAEVMHLKTRLNELESSAEVLANTLKNTQLESDRAHTVADRLRQEKAVVEAEKVTLETEISRLKTELRDLRAAARQRQSIPPRPSNQNNKDDIDLADIDGKPLSKLGPGHRQPQTRPHWWHSESVVDGAAGGGGTKAAPRSLPVVSPKNMEYDHLVRRGGNEDVVVPVGRLRLPTTDSSDGGRGGGSGPVELLRAEKREIENAMKTMPRNPAFRTSEQCEKYQKLYKELEKLDREIQQVTSGSSGVAVPFDATRLSTD